MTTLTENELQTLCDKYHVPKHMLDSSVCKTWYEVLFHDFVLLQIKRDSTYINQVKRVLIELSKSDVYHSYFVEQWGKILDGEDFNCLVERSDLMDELRVNSPFKFTDILSLEDRERMLTYLLNRQ